MKVHSWIQVDICIHFHTYLFIASMVSSMWALSPSAKDRSRFFFLTDLGWCLFNEFPPLRYLDHFPTSSNYPLDVAYNIYIWRGCRNRAAVTPVKNGCELYFCKTENFPNEEIKERCFSNPYSWTYDIDFPCVPYPRTSVLHDDVIKWKHFPRYWPFVQGIKRQTRGALMFSLTCVWINGWVNNREADNLRRSCAHYHVIVMNSCVWW